MTAYRQCLLRKPTAAGHLQMVSWLPERFATAGQVLRLKDRSEDGWRVEEVWGRSEEIPGLPPSRFQKMRD